MAKNIVICSDGTGNSAIKDRGTNVFKIFEAIDLNGHQADANLCPQAAIYDDGVGTGSFLPERILGEAFGYGLKRNVIRLYTALVRLYEPGDRIYLFGFSRGAFTVRTLAGLIARCGILKWHALGDTDTMRSAIETAYSTYRQMYSTRLSQLLRRQTPEEARTAAVAAMAKFKADHRAHDATIHFLGVWDTVDAVGGPFREIDWINNYVYRFKFPDRNLNPKVEAAAHALSLDDERAAFSPSVWAPRAHVDQVWFAGVHSNVGGGYPKQGMSLVTLEWMMRKASDYGLRILRADRQACMDHCSVDDKMYDPRAGLGVVYRWRPRDVDALWRGAGHDEPPSIHLSVFERIANGTDGYSPSGLPAAIRVVTTSGGTPFRQRLAATVADEVEKYWPTAASNGREALRIAASRITPGIVSHGLFLLGCTLTPFALYPNWSNPIVLNTLRGGAPLALALAAAIAWRVDRTRELNLSRFWHVVRQEVRTIMDTARASMPPPTKPKTSSAVAGGKP